MLEGLKDESGQLKKPVLFSLIGGAGLIGYLLLKGRGSSSSSSTTPVASTGTAPADLASAIAALQAAVQGQANASTSANNGATGGSNTGGGTGTSSLDPPAGFFTSPSSSPNPSYNPPTNLVAPAPTPAPPTGGGVPGEGGSSGGGGAGLGTVSHPISLDTAIYAGLTTPLTVKQQSAQILDVTTQIAQANTGTASTPQNVATIEKNVATYAALKTMTPAQTKAYNTDMATLAKSVGTAGAQQFAAAVPKK